MYLKELQHGHAVCTQVFLQRGFGIWTREAESFPLTHKAAESIPLAGTLSAALCALDPFEGGCSYIVR